jgi:hypothetical protein
MIDIAYATEPTLDPAEFAEVLRRSTLGERRPVDHPETTRGMIAHADLVVTARTADRAAVCASLTSATE